MSKYIDADKLKAKLDEHYRNYQSKYMETRNPYTLGLIDGFDLAEQVIDSLQQEQPKVDLEKEIIRFLESEESTSHTNAGGYDVAFKDTVKIAHHFYELGLRRAAEMYDEVEYNRQKAEEESK